MATIFAEYDFLTIACPDWHALVMGNYEYVMPLPTKAKLGIKYIYTPPFFSRLGIFSDQEITSQITTEFFNHIPLLYRQIDLLLAPNNPAEQSGLNPIAMRSYRLNLHRPYILTEQLFSENTRRNIKSANKVDLTYTQDLTIHEVVCLFKNGRGREKSVRYAKKDYLLLCKLAGYVAERGMLDVVGARDESGRLLAGALFLRDRHAIWFWFSGRDVRFPEKKAMFFVISEYLKTQEKQDNYLDFNGSMNENIARFYKGFGGESYDFPFVNLRRYSYLSPFIKLYKTIIKHDKI
ncbi:MAG: GNAT family N-acetyltransferase [Bacteroidales bacterium]|nr:GNAT family N-acetyltransferase [Bacteroidales bacterium]